ncbi:type ISP restriction/modification enzyme, partial [Cribrihabitans sp. XS_ASV171]
ALFKGSKFTKENPVSRAMEIVLGQLHEHNLAKESESLAKFYASVERRAEGVITAQGRQTLITELYDRFFRNAFPVLTQRLGIVYTPVEVVDFIIHSVNDVLKAQFGQTLGSKGVHILDPFTGTGTFITRLLQSGLIAPEELEHKYKQEIHANEIVLLAYYIAAINIETVYHELVQGELREDAPYHPFTGILLTDTFQMYEQERDMIANLLPDNSERRTKQKALDIRVIIGNPPYSAGQTSANDNAANIEYVRLDERIRASYVEESKNTNKRALYDSYIRGFRWASDRIGDAGVMAFVTNAGWIDGNSADGMRKCLAEEFSDLYIFHLRGNQRTSGELSRKEGGKIFGSGSRAPIAISVLVKNPDATEHGHIHFHDIGDYLDQKQKLAIIRDFGSVEGISKAKSWKTITPDENNDWLDQVDRSFDNFILSSEKGATEPTVFSMHTRGVQTTRDAWCFNSSKSKLWETIDRASEAYNKYAKDNDASGSDSREFSWCQKTRKAAENGKHYEPDPKRIFLSDFRPFTKSWLYTDGFLNWSAYRTAQLFPSPDTKNLAIGVPSRGFRGDFSVIMCSLMPGLYFASMDCSEFFPLNIYLEGEDSNDLFSATPSDANGLQRVDGITDDGLAHFQAAYPSEPISKEDLFYYIYGLLHSPDYRERFKNNLVKQLPRIPAVKAFADFAAFRDAGRALGDLHVNFESAEPYMVTFKEGTHDLIPEAQADPVKFYRVKKIKFGGKGKEKDKTTVIYNDNITMQNIPLEAYDYVVNGKPALEWVMERQVVKTDKASGIV